MQDVLRVENLIRNYEKPSRSEEKEEIKVLKGLNLTVKEKEFVGIMGKSGCGKSTLLKVLGMIDRPTDGTMFFKDKEVVVIGGGNSAAADALLLSKICKKVYVVHRRNTLRAEKFYHDPLMSTDYVEFLWNSVATEFLYDLKISGLKIKNIHDGSEKEIKADGVFISIGRVPQTDLYKHQIDIDENGYIIADETTKTNLPGVFAIGDVRTKPVRQIVTAVADGATAVHFAEEYLAKMK